MAYDLIVCKLVKPTLSYCKAIRRQLGTSNTNRRNVLERKTNLLIKKVNMREFIEVVLDCSRTETSVVLNRS